MLWLLTYREDITATDWQLHVDSSISLKKKFTWRAVQWIFMISFYWRQELK